MRTRTQTPHRVPCGSGSGSLLAFLSILVILIASLALSSCAGYTTAASGGGSGTGNPANSAVGLLSPSASSFSFGNVAVGSVATQTVSMTNTGTATVKISQAIVTGSGFTMVSESVATAVPVGQAATIQVQFAPTSEGNDTAMLTVTSNASNSPLAVPLSGTGSEAVVSMSPTSLSFNNVPVGQSSSQNVTITNSGNSNLTLSSATISGSGFTMSGLAPLPTIPAGQSTSFSVQFTPTSAASATGSIVFRDNAGNSPQTLALAGSGVATESTLSSNPSSANFGSVAVGSSSLQTITLTNSGTANITINQVNTTGSSFKASGISSGQIIVAGETANFSVTFAPTATGTSSGTITISSNATDGSLSIPLNGSGIEGALSANPSSVNFGSLPVGANTSIGITLSNLGTAGVSIMAGSITGASFSMATLPAQTLNPGQTTSFSVTFSPSTATSMSGSLSITSNAPGSPLIIALSGTGTQPQISANPTSVTFGTVTVGTSNSQAITLENKGNATLTFSQVAVAGTGFTETGLSTSTSIAAGGSVPFDAVFTPSSATTATGSITLTTNGTPSPLVINLSGTGATTTLSLGATPSTLSFGNVNDETSSSLTTSITNNGNSNITISGVTVTGSGFSATGISNGTVLMPGQSAPLTVTFEPTAPGVVSGASVTVTSNAAPMTISLSGTGTHWVSLAWTDGTTTAVTYNVFRGTSSGGEGTTPLNTSPLSANSFTDTNVTSGQTYFYTVKAVNSAGSSPPSNEAQVAIPTP